MLYYKKYSYIKKVNEEYIFFPQLLASHKIFFVFTNLFKLQYITYFLHILNIKLNLYIAYRMAWATVQRNRFSENKTMVLTVCSLGSLNPYCQDQGCSPGLTRSTCTTRIYVKLKNIEKIGNGGLPAKSHNQA